MNSEIHQILYIYTDANIDPHKPQRYPLLHRYNHRDLERFSSTKTPEVIMMPNKC